MKITLVILTLWALYLFMPRYNLYEQEGVWSNKYILRQKGFWSKDACSSVGRHFDDPYRCVVTSGWQGIWGNEVEVSE